MVYEQIKRYAAEQPSSTVNERFEWARKEVSKTGQRKDPPRWIAGSTLRGAYFLTRGWSHVVNPRDLSFVCELFVEPDSFQSLHSFSGLLRNQKG